MRFDEHPPVSILRRPAAADVRRPRFDTARQLLRRSGSRGRGRSDVPAARPGVRIAASWSRSTSVVPAAEIFGDYAYFSSFSDSLAGPCAALRRQATTERFGLDAAQPGRRDRQQRRLSAAALRGARHPGPGGRAGGERRRGGPRARHRRPIVEFFGTSLAEQLVARGPPAPTWSSPTTCSPTCPTSTTSSAGIAHRAEAGGRASPSRFRTCCA